MHRIGVFVYGVLSYACFFATFLYAVGFVGGFGVPRSIDSAAEGPLATAVLVDVLLLAAFALQHSVMARPAFKRWWTSIVPEPAERSTYVLASSVALLLLFWQWRPIGGLVWQVEAGGGGRAVRAVRFRLGDRPGHHLHQPLRPVRARQVGSTSASRIAARLRHPGPYRHVRHPLRRLAAAFLATPTMTVAHPFAIMTTAYILTRSS
jgi:protein-S-isoprenylcysteine O-methyltransferase Ste14